MGEFTMPLGVRMFVAVVFATLGLSFFVTTGIMLYEFSVLERSHFHPAITLASFYSHLFVFFPTFGIVALFAFYTPACVFTDMYWRYVPAGPIRFVAGFLFLAALSFLVADAMNSGRERSVWEVTPDVLAADKGMRERLPILTAVENVRRVSQTRIGLSDLTRNCNTDPWIGTDGTEAKKRRFCLASTPLPHSNAAAVLTTDAECCKAQEAFRTAMTSFHAPPENRSVTGKVHQALLPLKVFFLLVLLTISVLLAVRWGSLERHYKAFLPGLEKGVLIGGGAMVLYPIMAHAFLHSAGLIYGTTESGTFRALAPYISFSFGAWGLLLLLFFYRLRDKEVQTIVRMGGVVGSAVAIVKYDLIIDIFVRVFGSGANLTGLVVLAILAVVALIYLSRSSADDML
jgi:hypothetical protein